MNLLNCMDMTLDEEALNEIEKTCCFSRAKLMYIKFEAALKLLKYDNSTEQWIISQEQRRGVTQTKPSRNAHKQYHSIDV